MWPSVRRIRRRDARPLLRNEGAIICLSLGRERRKGVRPSVLIIGWILVAIIA